MKLKYLILLLSINIILNGCIKSDIPGGKIIFSYKNKLIEIDPDGKNMKTISSIGGDCISPDGKKIIYSTKEMQEKNLLKYKEATLYLTNINGENQIKLTEGFVNIFPSFSPGGDKVVFSSNRDGEDYEIYTMDIIGKNIIRLTDNSLDDNNPKWSSDGKRIVFYSTIQVDIPPDFGYNPDDKNNPLNKRSNSSEIYIIDADGKNIVRLTNNSINDKEGCWSPDSKKIAYVSEGDLCIMDVNGKNLINLTKDNPQIIKAAGDKSYYERYHGLKTYFIVNPCWSPCGKYISFELIGNKKRGRDIYTIDIEGKNIRQVTDLPTSPVNLAWLSTSPLDK